MSATMDIVVTAQDQASDVIEGIGETAESTGSWIEDNWVKVGAATAAAGAASEGFARSQQDTNATLGRMSLRTGESEDSLRGMIDGMVDATFSAHDAAAGMEALGQRGIDSREQFEELLPTFDSFADATGKDMTQGIDEVTRVLGAFGIPAEKAGDHIDTMTHLSENLGVPLDRLGRQLGRNTEELDAMGVGLDDSAAMLQALRDRGMDGRDAMRLYTDAVNDADGDMDKLLDTLGLTADEYADYQGQVADAAGITDEFADANNSTMTPIQRMQANVENLMARYGGLAEAAGVAAPALMAVGPAMKGVSVATRGLSAAMTFLAANPIVLVIAAVAALAAGLVYLWNNSETFRNVVTAVFEAVADAGRWMWENVLQPAWEAIQEGFQTLMAVGRAYWDLYVRIFEAVAAVVTWAWQQVIRPAWDAMVDRVGVIMSWLGRLRDFFGAVWSAVTSSVSSAWGRLRSIFQSISSFIRGPLASGVGAVVGFFSDAWNGAVRVVEGVWDRIVGAVRRGVNAAIGVVNGLIRGWNGLSFTFSIPRVDVSLPSALGGGSVGVGGQSTTFSTPNVPTIPRLAQGGIVRARPGGILANIGEGGQDEAVTPLGPNDPFGALLDEVRALRQAMESGQVLMVDGEVLGRTARRQGRRHAARNGLVTV